MEEEEKVVQLREWAKLKLVGQPLLSGRALWVAVRPLPRLVHIYHDSNLRALIRFPQDPSFLLLTPCQANNSDLEHVKGCTSEPVYTSLLVITSDGCLWYIQQISSHDLAHRPTKKIKQNHSKQGTDDTWDIFDDCDIYKDTNLYPDQNVHAQSDMALVDLSKPHLLFKVLSLRTPENSFRRVRAENVHSKAFVGKFPDACLAAVGPHKVIAVVSSSRSPIILNEASLTTDFSSTSTIDCHSNRGVRPSCLLFATIKDGEQRSQLEGLYLSPNFFNALARGFTGTRPKHLLLQGNTSGEVHIFSVDYANHITSLPMLLCDLKEPISKLIAFSSHKVSDALLVIGSHGYVVAINVSQSEYERASVLTSTTESSLQRLFRIDLRDAFSVHSWRVKAPVVSVTLYESGQLCFLSTSSLYSVNLLKAFISDPTQNSNHAWLSRETLVDVSMKKSLVCRTVPFFEVVVALAEGGPVVPGTNIGSLMALTSRGRLVAVQISNNILKAQTECFISAEHGKSWKPRMNRDGEVMVLLDEISATESCMKDLEVMKMSIDCALSELAIALRLAYNIVSNRMREAFWAPHQSVPVPLMSVHCNLEVKSVILHVDSQKLCFTPARSNQIHKVHPCFAESASNLKFCFKVTLANHGPHPVSPYWILLLDVHALEKTSRKKLFFSRVTNNGYGLAPHTSSEIDLQISDEFISNPLEVNIFLCHLHDYHDEVLQTLAFPHFRASEVNRERFEQTVAKYLSKPMEAETSTVHAKSKAACLLLSRYRVDILSLLKPPQRVNHAFDFLPTQPKWVQVDGQRDGTLALRSFLGKFQIRLIKAKTSQNFEERWKENGLNDVVKCCGLSKDGGQLSGADVHGNTVLLALDNKKLTREDLLATEIRISTSCPLMGYMVREAVLGRLKQQIRGWRRLEADIMGPFQNMDQVLTMLVDIERGVDLLQQDAENTVNLCHESQLEHSDVGRRVYHTFERAAEMYRRYRQDDTSNPFWGLVGQQA